MKEPLTKEKVAHPPMLYRGAPNVKAEDVQSALNGLRSDVRNTSFDVENVDDVRKQILYLIDQWFPAIKE